MDQLLAAASMVLSATSEAIEKDTAASALLGLLRDASASSSNFLAVLDEGQNSLVSIAMAGGLTPNPKRAVAAYEKWEALRVEQRGASSGARVAFTFERHQYVLCVGSGRRVGLVRAMGEGLLVSLPHFRLTCNLGPALIAWGVHLGTI